MVLVYIRQNKKFLHAVTIAKYSEIFQFLAFPLVKTLYLFVPFL